MSAAEIHVSFTDLERNHELINWMQRFGAAWLSNAQQLTQERTTSRSGEYLRGFRVDLIPGKPPKLKLGNISDHAIFIEEDTVAHTVPKDGKPVRRASFTNPDRPGYLRWFNPAGGGADAAVFSRGPVTIPAKAGQHIIKDALIQTGHQLSA